MNYHPKKRQESLDKENELLEEELVQNSLSNGKETQNSEAERQPVNDKRKQKREGLALCLSGGGYRAAVFHLGVMRRLNELGLLSQINHFSSVSGGSIILAHIAQVIRPWLNPGEVFSDWEEMVAKPFRQLMSEDLRTAPILKGLLPWNIFRRGYNTEQLAKLYEKKLTQMKIVELPENPVFTFCATDMVFGVNWIFEKDYIGDYLAGYVKTPVDLPLAKAVAASSCFPPVFRPLSLGFKEEDFIAKGDARNWRNYKELIESIKLTDGGNYDNLGLEPIWKKSRVVFVSDGGGVFDYSPSKNWFWQLNRYIAIYGHQSKSLRVQRLMYELREEIYKGAAFGIDKVDKHNTLPVYSERFVKEVITKIRTDLDGFTEPEIAILENHGYLIADSSINRHVKGLKLLPAELKVPHKQWLPRLTKDLLDESHLRAALANSNKRISFKRLREKYF